MAAIDIHRNTETPTTVSIDHDHKLKPSTKYGAIIQTTSSSKDTINRHSSEVNFKAYSVGDEDELDDSQPPSSTSFKYNHDMQESSFDLTSMRDNIFRDSLMPENGYGEHNSGGRATEMGNALMRLDEKYGRTYNSKARLSLGSIPNGLTPLLQAARAGDIVLVNALVIQAGTDILRRDPTFGQTALHFAIRGGHMNVVQALLMPHLRGSIINVADNRRNTALHLAAAKSRRMTKLLLECGADVNFVNMRNQTPLGVHILTVMRDDPTMTEILLQHRTNVNASVDKSTILHVALDKGLIQIAMRLVRHGARLDLKDESGKTVFDKVDKLQLTTLMAKVMHSPVWIPDNERVDCMECHKKFGCLGSRRHHCRMCGRVLCSVCSARHVRAKLLPFSARRRGKKNQIEKGSVNTRVCKMCYDVCTKGEIQLSSSAGYGSRA
ncbi:unnamed protein product [Peronospora belbahrii]|uniref:FYVE-type domain-containing protein n=1 Tax=Peronospora belbahrii TaxID=622444 RepID=A0AAU9L6U6_9STRA|nr:unnamed protein product [Peronospora belbahrii]CAH0520301.1 unnamed protein product [Peronospora belbahrii]